MEMDMSDNAIKPARVLAILWLIIVVTAHADPRSPVLTFGDIAPTVEAVMDAFHNGRDDDCRTADCTALSTIFSAYEVIGDSTATPMRMGMARTPRTDAIVDATIRPSVINKRLRVKLLSHPDRFTAVCARIVSFASLYQQTGPTTGDFFFINSMIQMALLMDGAKPGGTCLSTVLAAFPHTQDTDELIEGAKDFCTGSQWQTPACKRISR
jgi:hypothetical protein